MPLRFTKMHGLGNDFLLVGLFGQEARAPAALARALCDRRRGVGADGLILVGPPAAADTDLRIEIYNADGSRAEMCGNGLRCAARLARERGWARRNPLRIETDAGVRTAEVLPGGAVRAGLGAPVLDPARLPAAFPGREAVAVPIPVADIVLRGTCVGLGNPHAVFFVDDLGGVPLALWGPLLARHPLFPRGVNAHFAAVLRPDRVRMATWERGAGATLACGTGAGAVCVAGVLEGRTGRRLTAELPGGELELAWEEGGEVAMTGPAVEVFTGEVPDGFSR